MGVQLLSCLQLQLTPSTSPRRISSGSSRRPSKTRRVTLTPSCIIPSLSSLLMPIPTKMVWSARPLSRSSLMLLQPCQEHIAAKTATLDPHPIIDHGSVDEYKKFIKAAIDNSSGADAVELYWYMLEIFTDHDADKDGIIKMAEFPSMMKEFLATPLKHSLPVPC